MLITVAHTQYTTVELTFHRPNVLLRAGHSIDSFHIHTVKLHCLDALINHHWYRRAFSLEKIIQRHTKHGVCRHGLRSATEMKASRPGSVSWVAVQRAGEIRVPSCLLLLRRLRRLRRWPFLEWKFLRRILHTRLILLICRWHLRLRWLVNLALAQ